MFPVFHWYIVDCRSSSSLRFPFAARGKTAATRRRERSRVRSESSGRRPDHHRQTVRIRRPRRPHYSPGGTSMRIPRPRQADHDTDTGSVPPASEDSVAAPASRSGGTIRRRVVRTLTLPVVAVLVLLG